MEIAAAEIELAVDIIGHPSAADLHLDRALDLLQRKARFGDEHGLPVLRRRGEHRQVRCARRNAERRDDGMEAFPFRLELDVGKRQMLAAVEVERDEIKVAIGPALEPVFAMLRVFGIGDEIVESVIRHADRQWLQRLGR